MNKYRNICKCKICGDVIESKSTWDFKECKCGACFTDGGLEYVRRGWNPTYGGADDVIENIICKMGEKIIIDDVLY